VLDVDPARIRAVIRAVFPSEGDPTGSMTTVAEALGRPPDRGAIIAALTAGLGGALQVSLEPAGLSREEMALVGTLVLTKYGTDDWTRHGRVADAAAATPASTAC
jgi:lipoate-protein ligase A